MLARDLRYFVMLSRTRHFTRAAEELGITQPALSKGIRRLEETIRAKLVVSSNRRSVELTEAGQVFASRARIILGDIDAAVAEATMQSGQARGNLRVGAGPIFADEYLPTAIADLVERFPDLSFSVIADLNTKLLDRLQEGDLDLVFCTTFEVPKLPQLCSEDLDINAMVVLFRKGHPLEDRETLQPRDLTEYEWVMQESSYLTRKWLENKFATLDLPPPRIRVETAAHRFAQRLVERTDLLSFLPAPGVLPNLCQRFVPGLEWERRVGAVYRGDGVLPPAARLLISAMKKL
ncbi:LysR family transcriptional regulator [Mameliella sp. AT18]|uniref:LysR family transcriptional regulator n=1 Tax=Mameliella sp. AT18 TaxID=3028385 RepID=UPI000840FF4B|nr:LysR family transcriptional regulator [Mameliella sp. AT18]MDD9731012.1 LysR family transcriptional regulator [Mameliella sp. AT18]ODM47452.1 hypothetical protein A9320_22585 [Ruegeria sp. PBVC088]